jgi:hypothetical protein
LIRTTLNIELRVFAAAPKIISEPPVEPHEIMPQIPPGSWPDNSDCATKLDCSIREQALHSIPNNRLSKLRVLG